MQKEPSRALFDKSRPAGLLASFVLVTFSFLLFTSVALAQLAKSVDSVGMTVANLDRSVDFFTKVLSFDKINEVEVLGDEYEKLFGVFGVRMRIARLKLGAEVIELTQYLAPEGRPIPPDWRSNDHSFQHIALVVSDMDNAYRRLRDHNVRHASTAPQTIPVSNQAAAGIRAFYFKDPDGHHLEIIYFPPGKGDPRWQNKMNKLFLGIDHTAIVVSSTQQSLKFYRDLLGLKVVGESFNFGTEQEHLNNVAGARLHISALRAENGPGIEFLEYLTPRNGRPAPHDTQANDLWHWQTTLTTASANATAQKLRMEKQRLVSPGIAELPNQSLGFARGFLARDPDGHGLQFIER